MFLNLTWSVIIFTLHTFLLIFCFYCLFLLAFLIRLILNIDREKENDSSIYEDIIPYGNIACCSANRTYSKFMNLYYYLYKFPDLLVII